MCNLIGAIPESFANLSSLELLDLSFNFLTGNIPNGLFALRNLQFLYLYHNGLSGEIPVLPRSVRGFSLNEIDLAMNNLTGSIPEFFGMLENLTILHLFSNQLTGEIPKSLGLNPTLTDFKVFGNKLNGTLPPEFGLHSKIVSFEVANNQLSGGLPQHLCDGGVLKGVIAFSNNLSGELPQWMGNCGSLRTVQLYNNSFSGELPWGLWDLENLTTLMLSNNSFSGEFPSELAWNLSRLEIRNNLFSGKIFSSAVNLVVFDARNNMLSGEIPRALTGLSRLNTLMLDENQLYGKLPSEIISWGSLNTLSLSRNKLFGNIPETLCDLRDLVYLDLAENNISGEIPPKLGTLRLVFLNLSSNKLSGSVPDEFNNLAYESSFLNNPDLCAYNPSLNLSSCLTEKSATPQTKNSNSSKYLVLILVLIIIVLLASAFLVFYKVRKNCGEKHCGGDLSTWKLTSFQRLNFTEFNLFSSLTEENLIGSGGFGKVYRVASGRPGEYVAVKKIWNSMNLDERLEREFMAEVEILGRIRHSNVVKLLCCFSSENSKLLVYEYMENQSLDKWLHGRNRVSANGLSSPSKNCLLLKWPTRLRIAVGAAQGLCYMHHDCSPPIIHRDVKSSNILMDSEFRASIADFGLARMLVKPGEPRTMSNIAGSLGYIPPEYAYTTKIDEKADVYSFGVVLLELVTGKEPYSGGQHATNLVDWAWQHYREGKCLTDASDEEIIETSYVEEMITVFKLGLGCTSRLPSNRPSMKEILQVLRECCYPSASNGRRRVGIGFDIALLHGDTTYVSSYKDSNNKAISENEESCLYSV